MLVAEEVRNTAARQRPPLPGEHGAGRPACATLGPNPAVEYVVASARYANTTYSLRSARGVGAASASWKRPEEMYPQQVKALVLNGGTRG